MVSILTAINIPLDRYTYPIFQQLDSVYKETSYKNKDDKGFYALGHLQNTKAYACKNQNRYYDITIDNRTFSAEHGWRLSKESLVSLLEQNRIHIPKKEKGKLYKKIYLVESNGKPATDLWNDIHSIAQGSEKRKYPTQKPEALVQRLISMTSKEGDLVVDVMCGSGIVGLVAKKLGRKYIIGDLSKEAINLAMKNMEVSNE
jgi:DNA modification methylase